MSNKRDLEKRLERLERRRPCPACVTSDGADDDGDRDLDTISASEGDWVAERLIVQAEGEPAPSVSGCCPRCGREPHVMIVLERVVAVASAKSDRNAATPNAAPVTTAGNVNKPTNRPATKAKGGRRTR